MEQNFHHGFGHTAKPFRPPPPPAAATAAVNSTAPGPGVAGDPESVQKPPVMVSARCSPDPYSQHRKIAALARYYRHAQWLAMFLFVASGPGFYGLFSVANDRGLFNSSESHDQLTWNADLNNLGMQRVPMSQARCTRLSLTNLALGTQATIFSSRQLPQRLEFISSYFKTKQLRFSPYLGGESLYVSNWSTCQEAEVTISIPCDSRSLFFERSEFRLYIARGYQQYRTLIADIRSKSVNKDSALATTVRNCFQVARGALSAHVVTLPKVKEDNAKEKAKEATQYYAVLQVSDIAINQYGATRLGSTTSAAPHLVLKEEAEGVNALAHCVASYGDGCDIPSTPGVSYYLDLSSSPSRSATNPRVHVECTQNCPWIMIPLDLLVLCIILLAIVTYCLLCVVAVYIFGKKEDFYRRQALAIQHKISQHGGTVDHPILRSGILHGIINSTFCGTAGVQDACSKQAPTALR